MRVFLFEYATCGGDVPDDVAVEGLGMFKILYEGFSEASNVHSFIKDDFSDFFSLPSTKNWVSEFKEFAEKSDCALAVAPEDDNLLFNLTRVLEKKTENLGSSSKGVLTTSDKWLTYQKIKHKVNTPVTSLKPLDKPFIIKPRSSCGGGGIYYEEGGNSDLPDGYIAQEFVEGVSTSVSLLVGDEIRVLSVNRQILSNFRYRGAIVPFSASEGVEGAIKAVESVKGLFGYVGVDVVLGDVPYVIEINSRITTPAILFKEAYGVNVAELLMRNFEGKEISELKPRGIFQIKKIKGHAPNAFASCKGYSLVKGVIEKD
jgi:hypothetical protein